MPLLFTLTIGVFLDKSFFFFYSDLIIIDKQSLLDSKIVYYCPYTIFQKLPFLKSHFSEIAMGKCEYTFLHSKTKS